MTAEPLDLLRTMLLIRRFEERCAELYSGGQIRGFLHLYVGEEAVAAGVCAELTEDDSVVSTYREHGHALARGVPLESLMAEMFGKVTGCSRGRGGSMHLFDRSRRFVGGNAVVGGGLPLALGLALGDRMQGTPAVTACFFGDGAMAEGEFHEVLNLAVLWRLPLLLCCENNLYAMGTSIAKEHGSTELALRAASYGATAWRSYSGAGSAGRSRRPEQLQMTPTLSSRAPTHARLTAPPPRLEPREEEPQAWRRAASPRALAGLEAPVVCRRCRHRSAAPMRRERRGPAALVR